MVRSVTADQRRISELEQQLTAHAAMLHASHCHKTRAKKYEFGVLFSHCKKPECRDATTLLGLEPRVRVK